MHSMHRAAAGSLSSQLLHMIGFLSWARTAATSIMVVTTKFGGKAPTPRSWKKKIKNKTKQQEQNYRKKSKVKLNHDYEISTNLFAGASNAASRKSHLQKTKALNNHSVVLI